MAWAWLASSIGAQLSHGCWVTMEAEQGSYRIWKFNVIGPWKTNAPVFPVRTGLAGGLGTYPPGQALFPLGTIWTILLFSLLSQLTSPLAHVHIFLDVTTFLLRLVCRSGKNFDSLSWWLWSIMWDLYFNLTSKSCVYGRGRRWGGWLLTVMYTTLLCSFECSSPWPVQSGEDLEQNSKDLPCVDQAVDMAMTQTDAVPALMKLVVW